MKELSKLDETAVYGGSSYDLSVASAVCAGVTTACTGLAGITAEWIDKTDPKNYWQSIERSAILIGALSSVATTLLATLAALDKDKEA